MARAARYGGISPDAFLEMDYEDGAELARRVTELYRKDLEMELEIHGEFTKALLKAQGVKF
jgi:hypothetical protein